MEVNLVETQTEIPECSECHEKIRIAIYRTNRKQWKCKSCGKYFTFPQIKKTCVVCGVNFYSSRNSTQYCSDNCRVTHKITKIKICPICHVEFRAATKYCSFACEGKAVEIRKQELREKAKLRRQNMPKIKCLWCLELFVPNFIGILSPTCSPDCAYQFRKQQERIRKRFPFDQPRQEQELEKLRVQGHSYQLPERVLE